MFKFGNLSRQEFVVSPLVDQSITDTSIVVNTDQNSFGVDYGSNSFTPTVNGPPAHSNFHPFRRYWSARFNFGTASNITGFALGGGDFSIEFWINFSDLRQDTTYRRILSQSANDFRGFQIMVTDQDWTIDGVTTEAGGLIFYTDNPQIGTQISVNDDEWHFVTFQRSAGVLRSFVDGELQQQRAFTLNLSDTGTIHISRYSDSATQGRWDGYLMDLQIVPGISLRNTQGFDTPTDINEVHSSSEVSTFNSRDIVNKSLSGKSVARGPFVSHVTPFTEVATTWNWATYFDGTNDSVDIGYDSSCFLQDEDFTIEFWQMAPSKRNQKIIDSPDNTTAGRWTIETTSADGFIGLYVDGIEALDSNFDVQDNYWHHIAFVRSGSDLTIFVDGISRNTVSGFTATLSAHAQFRFGCAVDNTADVLGYYSNFRIVKGTALYLNNFIVSDKPLEAIDGTILLTFKDDQFADYSSIQRTITPSIDGTPTFEYIGPFWEYIEDAGSIYFDGSGDTIVFPTNSQFDMGTGNFTVEFWAYWVATTGNYSSWTIRISGAEFQPNRQNYTGGWRVTHGSQYNGVNTLYGATVRGGGAETGRWNHVAFTRTGPTWRIYVDGVKSAEAVYAQTVNLTVSDDVIMAQTNRIYVSDLRYTRQLLYSGDKFPLYKRPLSSVTERGATLASVELYIDDKKGARSNTTQNAALSYTPVRTGGAPYFSSLSPFGPRDWIPYFDGSSSRLYVRWDDFADKRLIPQTGENFTWEAWIRPEATTGAIIVFGNETAADDNGLGEGFRIDFTGFSFRNESNFASATGAWPSAIPLNEWSHIAVVRSNGGGTLIPYLNGLPGTLDVSYVGLGTTTTPQVSGYDAGVYIGYRNTDATYFQGHISHVRFTKAAVYQGQFTPNYRYPLTVIPETALLTCTTPTIYDRSPNNYYVSGNIRMDRISLFKPQTSYNQQAHGCAVHFPSNGNYLRSLPDSDYNIVLSNQWSWEAWIWPENTSGTANLFTIGNLGLYGNAFIVQYTSTTFQVAFAGGSVETVTTLTCANTWSRNCWHHVAVTWDSGNVKMFVNGRQQIDDTVSTAVVSNATYYVVNGVADNNGIGNSGNTCRFHGIRLVRNALLYTTDFALPSSPPTVIGDTQTKILLNFDDAMCVDQTGQQAFRFNGTVEAESRVPKYNGSAVRFNGSNNFITVIDNYGMDLGDGDFTIDFWIRKQSSTTYTILSLHTNGDYAGLFLQLDTSGRPVMRLSEDGAAWANTGTGTVGFGNNAWAHYAIVRSGTLNNNVMVFVNGVISYTATNVNQLYTSTEHYIGREYTGTAATATGYFLGHIDDFRITPGVARYTTTAGFTVPNRKPGTR